MSRLTRQELLDLLAQSNPRTRKTTLRLLEDSVSEDQVAFLQEELSFMSQDMTVRLVNLICSRTCDFGHVQDQQTRIVSRCSYCHAWTCSAPGCSFTCQRCGHAVCRAHARLHGEKEVCCSHCAPLVWLRELILGKRG